MHSSIPHFSQALKYFGPSFRNRTILPRWPVCVFVRGVEAVRRQLGDGFGQRERVLVGVDVRCEPRVGVPGKSHGLPLRDACPVQVGYERHAEGVEVDLAAAVVNPADACRLEVGAERVMPWHATREHPTRNIANLASFGQHRPSGGGDGQNISPPRFRGFRSEADKGVPAFGLGFCQASEGGVPPPLTESSSSDVPHRRRRPASSSALASRIAVAGAGIRTTSKPSVPPK